MKKEGDNKMGVLSAEQMHDKVCEPKFEAYEKDQEEIKIILKKTHKALCESNGKPSVLARLNKLEEQIDIGGKKMWGIVFKPIESRDIPRIIVALGMTIILLDFA